MVKDPPYQVSDDVEEEEEVERRYRMLSHAVCQEELVEAAAEVPRPYLKSS